MENSKKEDDSKEKKISRLCLLFGCSFCIALSASNIFRPVVIQAEMKIHLENVKHLYAEDLSTVFL